MPDALDNSLPLDPNNPRVKGMRGLGINAPQLLGPLADLMRPQPAPDPSANMFAVKPVAPEATATGPAPQAPKPLAQQYAELQAQEPRRDDPQYRVPTWKKALGLTAGLAIGSPDLVRSVTSGPYDRAEQGWKNKGLAIEQQSKIANTESEIRERDNKPDKAVTPEQQTFDSLIKSGKSPQEAYEIVKGAGKSDPNRTPEAQTYDSLIKQGKTPEQAYAILKGTGKSDTGTEEDQRYEKIQTDLSMKRTVSPDDAAWASAYEKRKTLGPALTAGAAAQRQGASFDQQSKMFQMKEGALTAATKTMIETAPTIQKLADKIEPMIDKLSGELGPGAGRWSEFWAGKVGSANPAYTALRTDVGLLRTALMRMHMGSRGSTQMMEYFKGLIDQGKQDPENLKAALTEIRDYASTLVEKGKSGGMSPAVLGGESAPKSGAPAGATHIGTSKKDGKDHYLDASGKDLGPVS